MATAQLLVGHPHPNRGGMSAIHTLELTEGSRPAWTLSSTSRLYPGSQRVIWIPTLEHMLEDALLMAAIHAFESEPVRATFRKFSDKVDAERLELYQDLTAEQRAELYLQCRQLEDFPKVVLAVYEDAYISPQIGILAHYRMECEVLMPVFSRTYSRWSNETTIKGELPACLPCQ
jgi:hypothetical protein